MKLLIYFIICNSIILFAQTDSTEKIVEEITIGGIVRVDSLLKPIGGLESIQNRLVYPPNALEREIEGNVYVLVKIDSLGNPSNPLLLKGIGVGCNEEAIRLV
ncbi:MAG: energy transducer TonB, partial [Ignavibacteriaceae bacterium]